MVGAKALAAGCIGNVHHYSPFRYCTHCDEESLGFVCPPIVAPMPRIKTLEPGMIPLA